MSRELDKLLGVDRYPDVDQLYAVVSSREPELVAANVSGNQRPESS